jgi:hypothetical protein
MNQNQITIFKTLLKSTLGLHRTRGSFLILLLEAFIKARTVNLSKLSAFIPLQVKENSLLLRYPRHSLFRKNLIRIFFYYIKYFDIKIKNCWHHRRLLLFYFNIL